jgi:hypothetical protein
MNYTVQAFRKHECFGCMLSETWNWVLVSSKDFPPIGFIHGVRDLDTQSAEGWQRHFGV